MAPSPNQNSYFAALQQRSRLPDTGQVWRWVGRDESGLAIIQSQRGDIVRAWLAGNAAIGDGDPVLYIPPGPGEVFGQVQLATVLPVPEVRIFTPSALPPFRIAMILDANWCFEPSNAAIPENVELLKLLTNNASQVITPPVDNDRFVFESGTIFTPLIGGADIAAAANIEVIEQPLDDDATGFIWLPLMIDNALYTPTELAAIKRNALQFGALLIGEWNIWGGGLGSYNANLIELFQPDFIETATDLAGQFQDLQFNDSTATMNAIGYWDIEIPQERIIGRLINRAGQDPSAATGKPGAIWLD